MRRLLVFGLITLVLSFACKTTPEIKLPVNNEVNFCSMLDSPQKYKARIIQTKAIVLGYHGFIFYSGECLDENKIIALEMSYEARHKMSEAIIDGRRNYKSNYLNGNLYAEITVLGELRENNEKQEEQVFRPKYKFFVTEIKNVSVLSEEILPVEKARGEKEIQK